MPYPDNPLPVACTSMRETPESYMTMPLSLLPFATIEIHFVGVVYINTTIIVFCLDILDINLKMPAANARTSLNLNTITSVVVCLDIFKSDRRFADYTGNSSLNLNTSTPVARGCDFLQLNASTRCVFLNKDTRSIVAGKNAKCAIIFRSAAINIS